MNINRPRASTEAADESIDGLAVNNSGADSEATSRAQRFTATQREIIVLCADAVQQVGFSRSVGQIFGVIYVSPRPVTFTDVVVELGLSKGSVSQGLRFLRELGAIKRVETADERREHFVAETELRRLLGGVLEARVRAPLELASQRLKAVNLQLEATEDSDRDFLKQRVSSLQSWHRSALFALPLVQRFLRRGGS